MKSELDKLSYRFFLSKYTYLSFFFICLRIIGTGWGWGRVKWWWRGALWYTGGWATHVSTNRAWGPGWTGLHHLWVALL